MINHGINNFQIIRCPGEDCLVEFNPDSPFYQHLKESDRLRLQKIRRNREILSNPEVKICRKANCDGVLQKTEKKIEC